MFDDLQKPQGGQGPAPVEDIFGGTDKVKEKPIIKPAVLQPKTQLLTSASASDTVHKEYKTSHGKRYFVLGLMILIFACLSYGGYWAFGKYGRSLLSNMNNNQADKQEEKNIDSPADNNEIEAPVIPKESPAIQETAPPVQSEQNAEQAPAVPVDSDQDGLTDEEETNIYLTDINSSDTDQDGLFDREEARVYHTDPKNKDSDGDGYLDGEEVKGNYNPNGPGKLYEIK